RQCRWRCPLFRNLDPAFPETLVIFLAGVLHHLPVGSQGEGPRALPLPGEGLGVVDDHFVGDVTQVGPREALDEMQLIAVRMANRIQAGPPVEIDRVDDQRVALPVAHRVAEPRRDAFAMLPAVDRSHGEPGVLIEQEGKVRVVLHDLHRLRRVDGAGHAEREAGAGVVAFCRVVLLPRGFSPRSKRQLGEAFVIPAVLGQVRDVRLLPDAAEVHFAGGGPGRRPGGRLKLLLGGEDGGSTGHRQQCQQRRGDNGVEPEARKARRETITLLHSTILLWTVLLWVSYGSPMGGFSYRWGGFGGVGLSPPEEPAKTLRPSGSLTRRAL